MATRNNLTPKERAFAFDYLDKTQNLRVHQLIYALYVFDWFRKLKDASQYTLAGREFARYLVQHGLDPTTAHRLVN